jgi:hypothetical protein
LIVQKEPLITPFSEMFIKKGTTPSVQKASFCGAVGGLG